MNSNQLTTEKPDHLFADPLRFPLSRNYQFIAYFVKGNKIYNPVKRFAFSFKVLKLYKYLICERSYFSISTLRVQVNECPHGVPHIQYFPIFPNKISPFL